MAQARISLPTAHQPRVMWEGYPRRSGVPGAACSRDPPKGVRMLRNSKLPTFDPQRKATQPPADAATERDGLQGTSSPWEIELAALTSEEASIEDGTATCVRCRIPNISGTDAEALSDNLLGMGAQSVVVQEHRPPGSVEQPIFDENPGSPDAPSNLWNSCEFVAYFGLEHDVPSTLGLALGACGLDDYDATALVVEPVANEQWVEQIKASYVPLRLSPRLCIVPEWSEPPQEPGVMNIMLQPGVAFGTGEHPTTRMCLLALEDFSGPGGHLQGASVMDYGAGSGVLALAALKLGAARAVGTDVDPLAVRSARRNAELNGYAEDAFCVLQCGQSLDDAEPVQQAKGNMYGDPPQFDIVCANILRGPLFELAPRLLSYAHPGSLLVLSGLLVDQVPEVMGAYAAHVSNVQVRSDGPW
eukprot:CAMPEP_0202357584 /NCGR_PEP_ID=MMETSP1126-20121109/11553_1 /ASSEMBLY_ACC=CAM_ASM_000457 /TAXON_ID=3047 /ORGANISM="Dunaliella tertiolecta, Strain CCMP1320" /LENGTH=415 /DNA_ID=CAMNT_0048950495 /DNA_START=117 /DNA_END=1362 /DNA_ORIENTATION=+